MKKLMISLLLSIALLSGCQRVTVRHSVPLPVEVVEHRHHQHGAVVVNHHEGGHHRAHHHSHPAPRSAGRVVVVSPPPVVSRHEVTIKHEKPSHHHRGHSHKPHGSDDVPHHTTRRPAPQAANRIPVTEVVKSWGKAKRAVRVEDGGVSVWDRVDGREKGRVVVVTPPAVVNRHEVTIKRKPDHSHRQHKRERHEKRHGHTPRSHNDQRGEKPSQHNRGQRHKPQGRDDQPHHNASRQAPGRKPVAEVVRSGGKGKEKHAANDRDDHDGIWGKLRDGEARQGGQHH